MQLYENKKEFVNMKLTSAVPLTAEQKIAHHGQNGKKNRGSDLLCD